MAKIWGALFSLAAIATQAHGFCDLLWDGEKLAQGVRGKSFSQPFRLNDKNGNQIANVTVGQIQAFAEAKERISNVSGFSPKLIVCNDRAPNAFATNGNDGPVVGVTIGMLSLVNGDRDMAAEVVGHEYVHHLKNHSSAAQTRDAFIGFLGLIAGIALERQGVKHGVSGLGYDLGQIGAALVSRKFDRDQEREADEVGFGYLVNAGFNPNGAINLSQRMLQQGSGGVGLFFDNHPGWEERTERFQGLIANNAQARVLANSASSTPRNQSTVSTTTPIALTSTYETTNAERSFNDGIAAWRRNDQPTAIKEFRAAANAGYASAQVALGYLYSNGRSGLPKDEAEAVRLYRLAADQGNPIAQSNLGLIYTSGRGGLQKDEVEAVRLYRLAADQGNSLGQNNLGAMYLSGLGGLSKDDAEGVRLYRLSADQNNPFGQANLGGLYLYGRAGLPKDPEEAEKWFRLSVAQGNPLGQASLGAMYASGLGKIQKDDVEAVRLYRLSADQGHHLGQANLGVMYANGRGGLQKDDYEAVRLYRLSADQGNSLGQSNLGMMYANGRGIQKDPAEAVRLFRLSAAQGNVIAQGNLSLMYAFGSGGLPKDDGEALRLSKIAADQGNATGQLIFGLLIENGRAGLQQDVEAAVSWYKKSAAQGNSFAVAQLKRLGRE